MMIEEKLLDQIWVQKALHLLATDNDLYSIMDSAIKKED